MVEIDHNIILHFLCTHKLDSTRVDWSPSLMEKDLIFFPIVKEEYPQQISALNVDQYLQRIKVLYSTFRERN